MTRAMSFAGAGGYVLLMLAACGEPGVTSSVPSGVVGGSKAPGAAAAVTTPPAAPAGATATAGSAAAPPVPMPAVGSTTGSVSAAGAASVPAAAGAPAAMVATAGAPAAGAPAAGAPASTAAAAGASAGAAGSGGGELAAVPPCPSGWTCKDPAAGITEMTGFSGQVKDASGKAIAHACGSDSMPQIMCVPAMNGADCPKELTKPICSLITIPGLVDDPLPNCAQLCEP